MKYLVLGAILYFMYKFMFRPSLSEGKQQQEEDQREEGEIEIRRDDTNPRGDFIDYEEVD